jgi:hypothetical protein
MEHSSRKPTTLQLLFLNTESKMDRNRYSQTFHGMGRGRKPTLPAWHTRENGNGVLATHHDTDNHHQGSTANTRVPNHSIENHAMDFRGQALAGILVHPKNT